MKNLLMLLLVNTCLLAFTSNNSFSQQTKAEGIASYYADKFVGRATASGDKYKHSKLTAAHKTLPFGTKVKVTNLSNKKNGCCRNK